MPTGSQHQGLIDTIVMLAEQIARTAPECANEAMQIVKLVQELGREPDRDLIRDTLEAETVDTDLSDARVQTTADAVMRAVRSDV